MENDITVVSLEIVHLIRLQAEFEAINYLIATVS